MSAIALVFLWSTSGVCFCQEENETSQDQLEQLKASVAANSDFNLADALLNVVRERQTQSVRWLLEKGASPNASDFITGQTALHIAVANEDLGSTLELLQRGANVMADDAAGVTPLELTEVPALKNILVYYRDNPVEPVAPTTRPPADPPDMPRQGDEVVSGQPERQLTNSLGMQFRLIESGTFQMGSKVSPDELGREFQLNPTTFQGEWPPRQVDITKPYYIAVHEVTISQFGEFVAQTNYTTDAEKNPQLGESIAANPNEFVRQPGGTWRRTGFGQAPDHPVVNISWNDARAFCQWLSETEKQRYRLPAEAEWEFACRAGTTTRFQKGDDIDSLKGVANVLDLTAKEKYRNSTNTMHFRDGFLYTSPVGSFQPNEFGLYDMHGNVWEWCSDWYDENFYRQGKQQDPRGPDRGLQRSLRGGCWY